MGRRKKALTDLENAAARWLIYASVGITALWQVWLAVILWNEKQGRARSLMV
jgi:hypothetical protein